MGVICCTLKSCPVEHLRVFGFLTPYTCKPPYNNSGGLAFQVQDAQGGFCQQAVGGSVMCCGAVEAYCAQSC
jgi:hypothetical protein